MATFNILSSCICRDAFGFQEDCKHEVITFLQSTSPFTWFEFNKYPKKPLIPEFFDDITELSGFKKKCVMVDYNKEVLESYEKKADFFIIDLVSFANTNIAVNVDEQGNKNYFTFSKWFYDAYKGGLDKYCGGKIQVINALELLNNDELMKNTVDLFIEWLINQKHYVDTQIILVRNKRVQYYSDSQYLYFFNKKIKRTKVNTMLDKIYDYFEFRMPNCHVVRMPYGLYADSHHKWGLTDLHLCKKYYEYLYLCFDLIAQGQDKEREKLFFLYSDLFEREKSEFLLNSIQTMERKQLLVNTLNVSIKEYIVSQGTKYYSQNENKELVEEGVLTRYIPVYEWHRLCGTIILNKKKFFVRSDECVKGYVGGGIEIGQSGWKTQNSSTFVEMKDNGVVVGHNGGKSTAQTQVIRIIENNEKLQGKLVTLSVYARVLKKNNEGQGGTVALINANGYNGGHFLAKAKVSSTEWEKVVVSVRLPAGNDFQGLTICLRALTGNGEKPEHAVVEYYMPQLEMGCF